MNWFEHVKRWRETKAGYAVFGAVELLGAGAFVLWGLGPDGGWLDWLCAVILVAGAAQNFVILFRLLADKGGSDKLKDVRTAKGNRAMSKIHKDDLYGNNREAK